MLVEKELDSEFQSAPLTKARGDVVRNVCVAELLLFQSAPLTKARGDVLNVPQIEGYIRFNPLPSQKQGETHLLARLHWSLKVSIRSPHKSKGRLV